MRKSLTSLMIITGCGLLLAGPVSADVVIHFVSGKTMPARSVRYVDDMVQVDLGGDGQIAFPRASIEKVVEPDRALNLERNTALSRQSRPMVAGSTEAPGKRANDVQITKPVRRNPGISAQSRVQVDRNGLAVVNSVPNGRGHAASLLKRVVQPDPQAARNNNVAGENSLRGTHFAGGRYVMATDEVPVRPKAVPIQMNGGPPPAPPRPPANDDK